MAIDSAPSAARVATKMIRTSRVAADRPRMIPRTLTIPSWLPRMKSERTVGFGWVARSLAMLASMAGPSRGTGKPFSLETARSYGPAAAVVCPGPSRSAEGCSRTEAYKPPLVSGIVRPRRRAGPAAEAPHGQLPDRERGRIDVPRARARPQGDRPRPGRLRVRAGAIPRTHLPHQGAEDRDPPVPQREGRLYGREEPREREDGDRPRREANRGGRHPDQEESRDRGAEHRRHLGPRRPARPQRGRDHPRAWCGRIRAVAVPRPRLPHRRAEGRPPHVRQRQGRLHGSP